MMHPRQKEAAKIADRRGLTLTSGVSGFGRIINISSVVGETGAFGQANYAASKSGLLGLTGSLALETGRKGITVNCVAPGYTDTDMVGAVTREVLARLPAHSSR
jgi:acetoacetyl-CoA reductase